MIKTIAIDDEPLALAVIDVFCAEQECINLQKTFTKPTEALQYLRQYPVDLLFLDIKMPAMTGMALLKEIQQNIMVIFTTAYADYAVESYELNAIDYLIKPINKARFGQAVKKAKEYYKFLHQADCGGQTDIFIRADLSLVKVPLSHILYVEGIGDYVKIFIKDSKTLVARLPMKEMLAMLPAKDFVRVHRSYIVPIARIQSIRGRTLLIPEREIPIGNTYVEDFTKNFGR